MLRVTCYMIMTKDQIVEAVANKTGLSKKQTDEVIESLLENITKALQKDDKVVFTGFGAFLISNRKARQGVNPKTGAKLQIPAMKVPKFRAGKALKEAVK